MVTIAYIHNDFSTKFGVPRQSGLSPNSIGVIIFEPAFRNAEALRGLDGYSYLWLLWGFSEVHRAEGKWSPTVRPPRLGGNQRMGIWATRSPFRPNPIGLSSVKIERIELTSPEGPKIYVSGADMMNNTPIFDIKPYLPFTDSHPEAKGGFALIASNSIEPLKVEFPMDFQQKMHFDDQQMQALREVLEQDPRPHYQHDSTRIYTMIYATREVRFTVSDTVLYVKS